jgi:aryl-alcohol dehydrogenase-like predicted oxidoreductase
MADLPKRELGRTGLQVTMLGYGAMELRGAPRGRDVTETQAETILNAVLDAGINYIDTSIDYGLSEGRIGRYIAERRSEYYLASKCGCLVSAAPVPRGQRNSHVFTRDNILAGVKQSLARMHTDHLDVLQFHASPSRQTLEEHGAVEAVLELKQAGTVRFIGMSSTFPNLSDHIAMGVFDVFQIPYSAVQREHEAVITAAAEAGAGIVIRGGAAKGAPAEGKQAGMQWERWQQAHLDDLLSGMTSMEFILRFTFTHPDMDTNIVGTVNPAHLQDNLNVLRQGPLPPDLYAEAKRRLAAAGVAP